MCRKCVITFFLLLFCSLVFAEMCPSVQDIQKNRLHGWKIYDSDDNTPLPPKRVAQFIKGAKQFTLAEWPDARRHVGTVHCYYRDDNGSQLEAYLAKDNFIPTNVNHYWYSVSGSMNCAAGAERCLFQPNMMQGKQLAKK
ncbi:MAG: hypothetical protein EPO11_07670 [Gammaproteobacteria bacterium]|nr:MAG: hypothetical protein EPO11_07670 [Gammaproteobacteria bacterium]